MELEVRRCASPSVVGWWAWEMLRLEISFMHCGKKGYHLHRTEIYISYTVTCDQIWPCAAYGGIHAARRLSLLERGDAGQHLALKELERGATAGRDV